MKVIDKCEDCRKSWTDYCPKEKCWKNNYSEYEKDKENNDETDKSNK